MRLAVALHRPATQLLKSISDTRAHVVLRLRHCELLDNVSVHKVVEQLKVVLLWIPRVFLDDLEELLFHDTLELCFVRTLG